MSIDEAIKHGTEQLQIFGGEHKEFIENAVDIMRKYQKIQDIIKNADTSSTINSSLAFSEIKKVVNNNEH